MFKTFNKIGTELVLGAGLLLSTQAYSQSVYFNGTVKGVPNNNLLQDAKVVAIKTETGTRVDSAYTNTNGAYNLQFIWDEIKEHEQLENKIYPNPYTDRTHLELAVDQSGLYKLLITSLDGKTLLNTDVSLEKGNNNINLSGGQAGVHLITLVGNNSSNTYKALQLENSGPINYNVAHTDFSSSTLKSGLDDIILVGDEVRLEFTKDGYQYGDTTFIVQPNNVANKNLQQIPTTFTTTLKPYLDDGTPVTTLSPGWTTTFNFPAPVGTKTYTPDANNEIVIQENFYPLNGELGQVTIHHDTTNYTIGGVENGVLSWIVLRTQNQPTTVRNKAQTSSSDLIPEPTTTVSLDSLDGQVLNYYTLPKKAETQPGTMFNLIDARGWMMSSGDGLQTSKFIQVPPYEHVVLMSTVYDNNPNQSASQANMDRAINEYNKVINITIMANNDNITQPTQFFYTNRNDSIWNACQLRGPPIFDNVELLTFAQSSPGVGRLWTDTYTYDGENRLYYTKAKYSESATDGQIFTENYSATYGIEEGSGSLGPYVYIAATGQPTDLAECMGRWVKILDLGSGNSKK